MREILYKAKGRDGEGWKEGYYWRTRDTTFCFREDYEKNPDITHHYILFDQMSDWGLPNRKLQMDIIPETLCQFTGSFAPLEASMVLTVGATAKDYRGDSWSGVNNQSEFYARSQNSFYKKTSNKKDRQKELLEEYLEKRAQVKKQQQEMLNEKIAKQEQERSRLLRSWNNERLLSKASNAYEANAMTEAVTDRAFALG